MADEDGDDEDEFEEFELRTEFRFRLEFREDTLPGTAELGSMYGPRLMISRTRDMVTEWPDGTPWNAYW